jgi:hypothetical protein
MRRFSGFTLVLNVFYCVTPEDVWGHREEARRWICSVWKLFTESSARILSWVWRTMMGDVYQEDRTDRRCCADSDYRSRVW